MPELWHNKTYHSSLKMTLSNAIYGYPLLTIEPREWTTTSGNLEKWLKEREVMN